MAVAQGGDNTALPEVHAASAGLKSFCSTLAADGMEDARKCCGGHGYSKFSGLPELVSTYLLIYTGEGENYLMTYARRAAAATSPALLVSVG